MLYVLCALWVCVLSAAIIYWFRHAHSTQLGVQLIPTVTPNSAFDREVAQRVDYLRSTGVVGKSVAVSNRDVCYKEAKYGGWMITGYELRCYSRYVQGFAIVVDRATVQARLDASSTTAQLFGESARLDPSDVGTCALYYQGEFNTLSLLPAAGTKEQTSRKTPHYTCKAPNQKESPKIVSGKDITTKDYAAFDGSAIDPTQPILWMQYEVEYYSDNTGCRAAYSSCDASSGMRTRN